MESFTIFMNFDGNCREVVEFYGKVFKVAPGSLQTYGEMPPTPGFDIPEALANKIMYADLKIAGTNIMFSDIPPDTDYAAGTNIVLTIGSTDDAEIRRWFGELKEGGEVISPLGETFFSKLYGMLVDKFGICWNIILND